ncbi:MAG: hypothetical protein AAF846_14620 [Chloroflexota bacterium]
MAFLVQTIPQYHILITTVKTPVMNNDPERITQILNEKMMALNENDVCHLVLDMAVVDRHVSIHAKHYIAVLVKLYEAWHYRHNLKLWVAVDESYLDLTQYLAQRHLLPIFLYTDSSDILKQIVHHYGKTDKLVLPEAYR